MADQITSVDELKATLSENFNPDKAQGMNAVFQFDLTGDNGDQFWVEIDDGEMEQGDGTHDDPTITLTSDANDFMKVVNGETAAMSAFMQGKIKIKGDMGLAMKLQSVFGIGG